MPWVVFILLARVVGEAVRAFTRKTRSKIRTVVRELSSRTHATWGEFAVCDFLHVRWRRSAHKRGPLLLKDRVNKLRDAKIQMRAVCRLLPVLLDYVAGLRLFIPSF